MGKIESNFQIKEKGEEGTFYFVNTGEDALKRVVLLDCYSKTQMYIVDKIWETGVNYWVSPGWASKFSGKVKFQLYDLVNGLELEDEVEYEGERRLPVINGKPLYFKSGPKDMVHHTLREIWWNKEYERDYVKVETNDVVVDVGANVGVFSAYALSASPMHVYCIEPMPDTFGYLKHNMSEFSNTTLINKAISKDGNEAIFIDCEKGAINSSKEVANEFGDYMAINGEKEHWKEVKVSTITFNDFLKDYSIEKIDFLKVDCEGGELDLFKTIDKIFLANSIKKIALEYHSQEILMFLMKILTENGFIIEHTWSQTQDGTDGMILAYNEKLIKN